MKTMYPKLFLSCIALLLGILLSAQVQTPRYITTGSNSNAFYEYLPQGYNPAGTKTYPLLIFVHGLGELGDGSPANLPKVLQNGPPKMINNGTFPVSFTVGGVAHKFIVISPQFKSWPNPDDINAVIDYAVANYKADTNRVYLTGLSMGGGITWNYTGSSVYNALRVAAIVPVCGAHTLMQWQANTVAAANVPIWATHNNGDPVVTVVNTTYSIYEIETAPIPSAIPPKKTIFSANGHDAWTATYDINYRENGMNIFEWMLQYQRGPVFLPVILSEYSAALTGKNEVTVSWTTKVENNNKNFTVEYSKDGKSFSGIGTIAPSNKPEGGSYSFVHTGALPGNNYYRVLQTDNDNKTIYFAIKKIVVNDDKGGISVFPNPAGNQISLQLTNNFSGTVTINIYNASGGLVMTGSRDKSNTAWRQQLDISNLPKGFYTIKAEGNNFKQTNAFIKN